MYRKRIRVVLPPMVATTTGRMVGGIVIVLPRFARLRHNQRLKAKARVFTTRIVLLPEPLAQLLCVAVIPVMGHTSIGIMMASAASD